MAVQASIIIKGPVYFEEGPAIVSQQAIEYVPHETVEQLISRLLYRFCSYHSKGKPPEPRFDRLSDAHEQTIEIRLIKEAPEAPQKGE